MPTSQNGQTYFYGQTHSNKEICLSVFDYFVRLELKWLGYNNTIIIPPIKIRFQNLEGNTFLNYVYTYYNHSLSYSGNLVSGIPIYDIAF